MNVEQNHRTMFYIIVYIVNTRCALFEPFQTFDALIYNIFKERRRSNGAAMIKLI